MVASTFFAFLLSMFVEVPFMSLLKFVVTPRKKPIQVLTDSHSLLTLDVNNSLVEKDAKFKTIMLNEIL